MNILKQPQVKIGIAALIAFAAVAAFQRHVATVPVVGTYLPR